MCGSGEVGGGGGVGGDGDGAYFILYIKYHNVIIYTHAHIYINIHGWTYGR